jgi:hypothetical protein
MVRHRRVERGSTMTAFVRTSVVMAVQVVAVAMLTQVAAAQTVEQVLKAPTKYGGYVLADPKCGCPASRPAPTSSAKTKYPTRCLAGNQVAGGVYLPVNDQGTAYPEFTYPEGFPYPNAYSANHPWLQGARTPGTRIAFPGWPAFKGNRTSEWDGGMRKTYIKGYSRAQAQRDRRLRQPRAGLFVSEKLGEKLGSGQSERAQQVHAVLAADPRRLAIPGRGECRRVGQDQRLRCREVALRAGGMRLARHRSISPAARLFSDGNR